MATYKQDMPPKGGYKRIHWARQFPNPGWSGYKTFAIMTGFTLAGWVAWKWQNYLNMHRDLETRETRIAISPLIMAEEHRLYLKHMRTMREEEAALTKDVPGWEVGTLWGTPVYQNKGNRWIAPANFEMFSHSTSKDYEKWSLNTWIRD